MLAGLSPDAVWITGQDTAVGRAALAELFDDWLWSLDPHLETIRLAVDDETAAAELRESFTVDGSHRVIEVNIFDFNQDIYGRSLRIFLKKRLRGEQKFSGLEALKEQLGRDRATASEALNP